jgi:hypothetical protein
VDISSIAGTSQDKIHRPHEAQQKEDQSVFLEGGAKYSWKEIRGQNVEQRLKEMPFRESPPPAGIHHNIQTANPDTIADSKKCLLTGA